MERRYKRVVRFAGRKELEWRLGLGRNYNGARIVYVHTPLLRKPITPQPTSQPTKFTVRNTEIRPYYDKRVYIRKAIMMTVLALKQ